MKILIYGSTYISALVEKGIFGHTVIGHVPSENPVFPGKMLSPIVTPDAPHDIAISIQYDKKIKNLDKCYNLHTGLLPKYGGCDILYHTIQNKEKIQGLTFHKITEKFDEGEIISKIIYPVLPTDRAIHLYKKMCVLAPDFVNLCLRYIQHSDKGYIPDLKPIMHKRGLFPKGEVLHGDIYKKDFEEILQYVKS